MRWYSLPKHITREDVKIILWHLNNVINYYGYATLSDFHDLVGSKVVNPDDDNKIWRSLEGARVSLIRRKGRYRIKLPDFIEIPKKVRR